MSPSGWSTPRRCKAEVDAYSAAGVFATPPSIDGTYNTDLVKGVYDASGQVIWPS